MQFVVVAGSTQNCAYRNFRHINTHDFRRPCPYRKIIFCLFGTYPFVTEWKWLPMRTHTKKVLAILCACEQVFIRWPATAISRRTHTRGMNKKIGNYYSVSVHWHHPIRGSRTNLNIFIDISHCDRINCEQKSQLSLCAQHTVIFCWFYVFVVSPQKLCLFLSSFTFLPFYDSLLLLSLFVFVCLSSTLVLK